MSSNRAALAVAGLTVGPFVTEPGSQQSDAITKNDQQEALKAQLRMKAEETVAAFGTLDDNTCDEARGDSNHDAFASKLARVRGAAGEVTSR